MSVAARTTANAAQDALETRLRARADFADTLVQHGLPAEEPREDDRIYLAAVDDLLRSEEPAGLAINGAKIYEETYQLTLFIEAHRAGASTDDELRAATKDRMWAMIAEIEQELADDVELVDDVDEAYVQAIPTAFTVPHPDGWIAKAVVHIRVKALCSLG